MKQMKKFLLMLFVAAVPMGFVACSDDDKEDVNLAKAVAGTYEGEVSLTGFDIPGEPDLSTTITVTEKNSTEINISLGKIDVIGGIDLGTVEGAKISGTEGNITIAETSHSIKVSVLPVTTKISGTIKESKNIALASKLELDATLKEALAGFMQKPVEELPDAIVVNINGTKKQ